MIESYADVKKKLNEAREKGHFVFLPSPILSMEDSFYQPMIETVTLREDEVYSAQKKFRIHAKGLLRLAAAAAFEWSVIDTCRTDGRTDREYCSFRAVGGVRKADGRIYFHKAEDELDLALTRDELYVQYSSNWEKIGTAKNMEWKKDGHTDKDSYVNAMVKRDLIQKSKNKLKLCETGAKARVIRFVLGLQAQYSNSKDVIGAPFVMVHYALNIRHPEVKKQLAAGFIQSQSMIYGGVADVGQIEHRGGPDIIDIPNDVPDDIPYEEQKGFTPEPEPEPEFIPAPAPEPEPEGRNLDFENCSIDEQVETLKRMCKEKNIDFSYYEKTNKKGVAGMTQGWRNNFFNYLVEGDKK